MQLSELRNICLKCTDCPLHATRLNLVFGSGLENTDVLFVGEAPGKNEDETGTPFVGLAGQLLDLYLEAVGIARDKVYITNILKCRPPMNRDPNPEEQAACMKYLDRQIEILDPKIIVCLGRISAQKLIDPNFRVTQDHGKVYRIAGRTLMGTYHPAALLRNPGCKGDTLRDFEKIAETIKGVTDNG